MTEDRDYRWKAQFALNVMDGLSKSARRVAGAIIGHFNHKTGQCDPSVDRLAKMLDVDRATVIRATSELDAAGLIAKESHGGKSHRSSYSPNWELFTRFVDAWNAAMETGEKLPKVAEVQRSESQDCNVEGRKIATQTFRNNHSKEPSGASGNLEPDTNAYRSWQRRERFPRRSGRPPSEASREAAARRLDGDLLSDPEQYTAIIDRIDDGLMERALVAEQRRRHAGLDVILAGVGLTANGGSA